MKTRLVGLNSLRGIAALALIIFHVRGIPMLECPLFLNKIIDHLGSGVPLFYAISAFSLSLGYDVVLLEPGGISHFYLRRFFRIIPLFYVVLCVSLLMRAFYFHAPTSFSEMVLNVTCLFGLFPSIHEGLVWASWSIGVEWLFYFCFPALLFLSSTLLRASILFAASFAISFASFKTLAGLTPLSSTFGYMSFGTQLVFFSGGLFAFRASKKIFSLFPNLKKQSWMPSLLILLGFGYFLLIAIPANENWLGSHGLSIQVIAIAWVLLLMSSAQNIRSMIDFSWLQRAGKISFSLYLLNPIIIFWLSQVGFYRSCYTLCGSSTLGFMVSSIFSIQIIWIAAEASFFLVEQPGVYFGKIVRMYVSKQLKETIDLPKKEAVKTAFSKKKVESIFLCFILAPWLVWGISNWGYKKKIRQVGKNVVFIGANLNDGLTSFVLSESTRQSPLISDVCKVINRKDLTEDA